LSRQIEIESKQTEMPLMRRPTRTTTELSLTLAGVALTTVSVITNNPPLAILGLVVTALAVGMALVRLLPGDDAGAAP
jgi:hypothetical protein